MSARDKNNKRLETIEVNLDNMKVMQVRGACNKNSKYHKNIINVLESAMPVIAGVHKSKKRKLIKEVA
jgi:hypothetical protein